MGEKLRRFSHFLRAWPVKFLLFFLLLGLVVYLFRIPLMTSAAEYLIRPDEAQKAEVAFVLGGSSMDRGKEAAKVYQEGWVPQLVTTGENVPSVLEIKGIMETEAQITRAQIIASGVHKSVCVIMNKGTSTMEEAHAILYYCDRHGLDKIMIISSNYHLRRINNVFRPMFKEKGIEVVLHGTSSSRYNEMEWWKTEEGLIALNNEYMKLLYYWWKY